MDIYNEIIFDEISGNYGSVGVATLNRPKALNALNHTMIRSLRNQLHTWSNAKHIKAVVIQNAAGRAFCAGGDLRLTYERTLSKDPEITAFFRDEYHLNRTIFHYPKPYIAFLNGITMGGGVGISIHGSHRVATEELLFAMPETGIGFYPDVGGTYFLPRLPAFFGFYLGLTGDKIKSDDCMALGLTHHKVASDLLPEIIQNLADHPFEGDAQKTVTAILKSFERLPNPSSLLEHEHWISTCFSKDNVEAIFKMLESQNHSEVLSTLSKKSPTSLKVTLKAMMLGSHLDFDACMEQEFRLTTRFLQNHDFAEGIRALIIDKDQSPKWQPNQLSEVKEADVGAYFEPIPDELS